MWMDFVDPELIFCITLAFDKIIFLVSSIGLPAINRDMFLRAGMRIFGVDIKMTFSNAMKADCIICYAGTKSPTKVKRIFKAKYGKNMIAL